MAKGLPAALVVTLILVAVALAMPLARPLLHGLFPEVVQPIYGRASFLTLLLAHLRLVVVATGLASGVAMVTGVFVTRPAGRVFAPLVRTLATVGQTFPPVAVLALAVPLLGYGATPTLAALAIYAALPVLEATLAGSRHGATRRARCREGPGVLRMAQSQSDRTPARRASSGCRPAQCDDHKYRHRDDRFEPPAPCRWAHRSSRGLSASNPAYVIEGAIVVALLAVATDRWFDVLDASVATS